jgi:uncharacterized membrane protein HdeD (DUF308 family)
MKTSAFGRTWLVWTIRGVGSIVLGAVVILRADPELESLAKVIGVYALGAGVVALCGGVMMVNRSTGPLLLVMSGLDLLLGLAVFVWPGASAVALLWPVALVVWALLEGVVQLIAAARFRFQGASRWLGVGGALTLAFSVVLAVPLIPGTNPIVWLVGGYAIVYGAVTVAEARLE